MESLPQQIYADVKALAPKIADMLGVTTEFLLDVGMRYVTMDIVMKSVKIAIIGVLIFIWEKSRKRVFKNWKKLDGDDRVGIGMFFVCVMAPIFLILVIAGYNAFHDIIKGIVVPEIRLFELFSETINTKK